MKKNNKLLIYLTNIIIVMFILILILTINKISPFGQKMIGISDAPVMFKPMLFNFITKLRTGTLLNYSFNNGLGNATIFDFLYDLASPFNLIALLFKSPDMMFLSATLIKVIVATICMTFYASKKTNNNYVIIIATLSYVFSSWFITYYYYLPWLDIFMIFPLFQYGLEKLINEHKYHIYIFALAYMMATNLYLCFSVCIYTIFFFIVYELFYKKEPFRKKILTFDYITLSTICSFLLAAFYLYGWFDSLIKIKMGLNKGVVVAYTVSFVDFIKSFYYSNLSFIAEMEGKTFPNIACPTIILISYIYYFLSGDKKRNKIFVLLVSLLCIAIIFIPQLDFIMNAFHKIRGLTYRYSFIFSFLMICLFIHVCNNLKEFKIKPLLLSIGIALIILLLINNYMNKISFIISITFILTYLVLIVFYNNNTVYNSLFIILMILQISFVTTSRWKIDLPKETPDSINYNTKNVQFRINNPVFEKDKTSTEANSTYYNRKTTFVFSSMTYSPVIYLFSDLGNATFDNTYSIMFDYNKIPTLLLNVKSKENDYYLEKIYAVNKDIINTTLDEGNTKYNMENLVFNMTGIKDIYDEEVLKGEIKRNDYEFWTDHDYYLIEVKNENGGVNIVPQEYKFFTQNVKYGDGTATIYAVNDKKLKEIYDYLKKNQIKYSYYNDNHIIGNINVDKDQIIFTSIPYDKDWIVKVDGKIVQPIELLDSLMGIEVKEGKHRIELEYKTHFLIPALISISTFIILIIDYIRKRIKHQV